VSDDPGHVPVLLHETLDLLAPAAGETAVDCTLGRGGHAAAILPRLGPGGTYVGLDLDPANIAHARERLGPIAARAGVELVVWQGNFAALGSPGTAVGSPGTAVGSPGTAVGSPGTAVGSPGTAVGSPGTAVGSPGTAVPGLRGGGVDVLLADLGFASTQMDDPARGFSFAEDGPLDMRLDPGGAVTAAEVVNHTPERELADLIYQLGEERLSRRIARHIAAARHAAPIQSTRQLAELVRRAYGPAAGRSKTHPATRTFMALRIAVNGELEALDALLAALPRVLAPGGRAGIISFHSLEDRRVKRAYRALASDGAGHGKGRAWDLLTRSPVTPGDAEVAANPRSRSAKLRVIRRPEHDDRRTGKDDTG